MKIGSIDYLNYFIFLLLASGGLTLRLDAISYEWADLKREHRAARLLGWLNLLLGIAVLIVNWVYKRWF
ncbi:CLC_0170 family protein [Brevibacillus sp. B_LB10_24]|uniref:CLC_0170 family protein n=1 Tax=Brevibacillus sp. B_LB10_24 TaxID=3380645 RepID=UPI0038BAD37A